MTTRKAPTDTQQTERQGRTAAIRVRWLPAEVEAVTARAAAAGVNVSTYVRAAALGAEVPAPKRSRAASAPRLDAAEFRQLVGIANNLNQIARTLNAGRPDLVGGDLGAALAELRALWSRYL